MVSTTSLDRLAVGRTGRILHVNGENAMRRRLMDLGFTPGTEITALHRAMSGDPTAYRIRGTVIAIREIDAGNVIVDPGARDDTR